MAPATIYTEEEVAQHSIEKDCWLIINADGEDRVYDVTKYLSDHPGGPEIMLEFGGKDATDMFEDIGHSSEARKKMAEYLIGTLKTDGTKKVTQKKKSAADVQSKGGLNPFAIVVLLIAIAIEMTSRLNILIRRNFHRSRRVQSSITPFKLADIGEGITEVELMKWFVKAGDKVKSFDRLCEVQSDKATVEITSRYDGVIESIHHEEGAIVKVGDALVDIKTLEVSSPKLINTEKVEMQSIEQTASIVTFETSSRDILSADGSKSLATPAVRKIAKERGLDLSRLVGSGPKGRVLKEDVLRVNGGAPFSRPSHSTFQTAPKQSVSSPTFDQPTYSQPTKIEEAVHINIPNHGVDTKVPIRGIQRIMVASMNAACEVQHLTLGEEIVFDKMISLKRELSILLKSQHPNSSGKISFLPFLIKAASLSLQRYPVLNATVNKEATEMILHHNHNIGVAMDTPKGLLVPVIDRVQDKSIFEIASDLTKLQADAATGNISEKQLRGGTFSLSNIGSIGGTYAVPVLLVPQVAIGALGRVQTVPRYVSKKTLLPATLDEIHSDEAIVKPQSIMNVSWSADHRVIDGATVARFSNMFKSYVEKPEQMLANMR